MSGPSECLRGLHSIAFVTVPSIDVGKTIAHGLVKNKLAACVNIVPQITSVYEWEGSVNEDSELLLMIKTRTSLVDKLTSYVRDAHPYTVCEVITLPIASGNEPYLKWISEVLPEENPSDDGKKYENEYGVMYVVQLKKVFPVEPFPKAIPQCKPLGKAVNDNVQPEQ